MFEITITINYLNFLDSEIGCKGTFKINMSKALNKKNGKIFFLKVIYGLLFRIFTVKTVSDVRNRAKTIKKFIFSIFTFGFPLCKMGSKRRYEIPILIHVKNKKA